MLPEQQIILRLLVSAVLGSVVGLERERLNWVAGLRTHMLVCVGSTLFMIVSAFGFADIIGNERVMLDPSRVAAQVVSGIGFLGAGTIILRREVVRGLTTAASLWSVAAVGLAVGGGLYLAAVWGTALILVILAGVKPLERRFSRARQACLLILVIDRRELSVLAIESALEAAHLRLKHIRIQHGTAPNEDRLQIRLRRAPRPSVLSMAEQLRSLPGVREVRHTGS
jgi:putative Mg2+ transporter-C (MgtC) family protein